MLSQTTLSKSRDRDGAGEPVRPSLRLMPGVTVPGTRPVAADDVLAMPERRVCLGCRSWRCASPRSCARVVASMVLTPCIRCRGIGSVRLDGPGGGFVECDPCDGFGLTTIDGGVIEIGDAA